LIPRRKHIVAKQLADRLNHRSKQQCETTEQIDDWMARYAQAINTLSALEQMQDKGLIQLDYTPTPQPKTLDDG
jgi:hypothetical protein